MSYLFRFCFLLVTCVVATSFDQSLSALAQPFRTMDGSGNNVANPSWGQAETALQRLSPHGYPDGIGTVMLQSPARPNARAISNAMFAQTSAIDSARGLSSGVWQWGQFLDHDIDLSPGNDSEAHMIMAPLNDPYGMSMIPMHRSAVSSGTGELRQQTNAITSYIDASNVYGADLTRAAALRLGQGGRMLTSANNLLPTSDMAGLDTLFMDGGGNPSTMFVAGDVRANEQLGLTAMHTLFVREHNRIADALANMSAYDAIADDELIYQKARTIVGAQMQAITYNEFLPMLLGDFAPAAADYDYDINTDASIANEFSTALFRVGHTMLNENLILAAEQGNVLGEIPLREAFFTGSSVLEDSPELIDKLLMGLATQTAQEIDAKLVDDVRNFLFAPHAGMGFDLAALNIERGRDHGLADYNSMRAAYASIMSGVEGFDSVDLSPVVSFAELPTDAATISVLMSMYDSVDNIDPWVMAIAEQHVQGTSVGPLVLAGLVDQFTRLRDGDAHFYMGNDYLWSDEVAAIVDFDDLHLMDIVSWNTEMKSSPMNFFSITPVPEPSTFVLLLGGVMFAWLRHRTA